ncbi:MAG: FecR family protein [Flavitalea sp.]
MIPERIELFAHKFIEGSISKEELNELNRWYASHQDEELLLEHNYPSPEELKNNIKAALKQKISSYEHKGKVFSISVGKRWFAAAAIAVIAIGIYITYNMPDGNKRVKSVITQADASPGGNKAILTLGDGTKVLLDNAHNGLVALQGKTSITKLSEGQLAYDVTSETSSLITTNTMSTPRGGQYQLRLPDGTIAWLNAASSITYPTAFTDKERVVKITGEIYFEVYKDPTKPFRVILPDASEIKVLGTHFNVNSYSDEGDIRTTLLEGKVKVNNGNNSMDLAPLEQAVIDKKIISLNKKADITQVMAWKNGWFNFEGADLKTVLRQLSRWYDVDVVYEGNISTEKFGGEIERSLLLSQVLNVLKSAGAKFSIEGKKLIVAPQ